MDIKIKINDSEVFCVDALSLKYFPGKEDSYYKIDSLFERGSSKFSRVLDFLQTLPDTFIKTIELVDDDDFTHTFECVDWKYEVDFNSNMTFRHEFICFAVK